MKKKISLILCLLSMVLVLGACGVSSKEVDYFGLTYSELKSNMEQEVASLVNFTDENRTYINDYGTDIAKNLVITWDEATADLGAYQGLGEFDVAKAQDSMTVEQIVVFPGREVVVTYVYEYNYETEAAEIISASAEQVSTFGEKMANAGMNTLLGMGTVFAVLILISLIISCFKLIPYFTERKTKKSADNSAQTNATTTQPVVEEANLTDDLELVAVISAAIAASAGTSTDSFVVRSIHRR